MEELIADEKLNMGNMIYEIRGKQVMPASDVAKLYSSETKIINQVVKKNINRFPEEFCFQLTNDEYMKLKEKNNEFLRSQIVILNNNIIISRQ